MEDLKMVEETKRRLDCASQNKHYYEVPKSRQPVNKQSLRYRNEAISKALYGRPNHNTSVVIFDNDELKSVCFGLVTSPSQNVNMKSKNDVAVSVLAHVMARIKLNDCLPSSMASVFD